MGKADWPTFRPEVGATSEERLFFNEHQWQTVEAATSRIIPTDHQPGAREANVVRFIDRYLAGIDYVYASADGTGFLAMDGKHADAWRGRIGDLQHEYLTGLDRLDEIAHEKSGAPFKELEPAEQDQVLEILSGHPKPTPVDVNQSEAVKSFLQGVSDDGMTFFDALCLHTRQGFYADPVYGGNQDYCGWEVIGFPGPKSLAETNDCSFSLKEYFVLDYDWAGLIPHLREGPRSS